MRALLAPLIFNCDKGGGIVKRFTAMLVSLSIAMLSLQGCYGKMALTKKVYALNGEVNDKFVRSLVTWAFIFVPVYGVSALVDFVLFNTIEFWTGRNPVAQGEKDFKYTSGGESFEIHAKKTGTTVNYLITHYKGNQHLDTMSINWDIKSGNSAATLTDSAKTTEYRAVREKGGVTVTQTEKGSPNRMPEMVAQYR
jgi:hypothetical protein